MNRLLHLLTTLALCSMLAACGTDSSSGGDATSSSSSSRTEGVSVSGVSDSKPAFSLRLTDAPIDNVVAVVLSIVEVSVHKDDRKAVVYRFDTPRSIDLLSLQGTKTADLLIDMPLDDGEYHDIRLVVDSSPMANYIDLGAGGLVELQIGGGKKSNITIAGKFTVTDSRPASLVADFDLRQSVKEIGNSGRYRFDARMRLVSFSDTGHVRGTVDPALLASTPECSDNDPDTFNAVYVFEGHDAKLDDIDHSRKKQQGPVTTTFVKYDATSMTYLYEAAFLPAGKYTIAVTCNADREDLDKGSDNLRFFGVRNATVIVKDILFL